MGGCGWWCWWFRVVNMFWLWWVAIYRDCGDWGLQLWVTLSMTVVVVVIVMVVVVKRGSKKLKSMEKDQIDVLHIVDQAQTQNSAVPLYGSVNSPYGVLQ